MIQLRNVSYTYPNTTKKVLNNINLDIRSGECVVVTGQAGAGKTTMCLAAAGILQHEYTGGVLEGSIAICGQDVKKYRDMSELGSRIGVVFDDSDAQLIFTTVEEEILSGLEHLNLSADEIEKRLAEVMEQTKITQLKDRAPHTLSGGQKQRVVIAVTLALGTEVLVLDEPTSELDVNATELILDILAGLKKQGKAILLIEHKINRVARIADRIILLEDGHIALSGSPEAVKEDPRFRQDNGSPVPDRTGAHLHERKKHPGSDGNPAIVVSGLVHRYGDILALDGINLTFISGECTAIIGDNGSGKTTLIKHFNGLLHPTEGSVMVKGRDTVKATVTELARDVGLVFQNPDTMLFADTVKEEIAFGLTNTGVVDQDGIIDKVLSQVHLGHAREQYPRALSRGERQRLAVACVIAMQPLIIILDEPTTGLDLKESREVMDILKQFQGEGHAIIIVTHSMGIVDEYADRVIRMGQGKILSDEVRSG
jgi:energy-coupling factor transport system ATP-binding protein